MASVDGIFRQNNVSSKRKFEDPTKIAFQAQRKSAKLNDGASPHTTSNGTGSTTTTSKSAFVEDDDNDEENDVEAGPALPPDDDDADEHVSDDDEGRFFGGGVSKQEKEVLDYLEQNEGNEAEEEIDLLWLKKTTLNFERRINKNAELRGKYEDEPLRFVGSEADLDAEIKNLSLLSGRAELYPDFVKSGCVTSLVDLLAHDNTDIAISALEVLTELTDEDSGASEEQWRLLVEATIRAGLIELLVSNLSRFDEYNESDRAGVYHALNVLENLSSDNKITTQIGESRKILQWLLSRSQKPDSEAKNQVGQNRQYAAELLAILLQDSQENRKRVAELNGADTLLQVISTWRRKDPEENSDEEELAENLFNCLISLVREENGAESFVESEGVELCVIMLKEGRFSKLRALRVLDHAAGGPRGRLVSERVVEAAGLKTLFTMFMKSKKTESELVEHLIGIFVNMLRNLPADEAARIRTLAKLVEKDYEKTQKLLTLRADYVSRQANVNARIKSQRAKVSAAEAEELEEEWLSARMDAGLFVLQTIDVILAWLAAEDHGAKNKISEIMASAGGQGLVAIRVSLQQQLDSIDLHESRDERETREMLETLIACL